MTMRAPARLACAAACGLTAILLASCGGSNAGLIPSAYSTPLQHDFETVLEAARTGNGACGPTETALKRTQQNFRELPSSVNGTLHTRLSQGISYLYEEALKECATKTTTTTTTRTKTTTATEITATAVATSSASVLTTVEATTVATTTPENGGGTQAPPPGSPGGSEAGGNEAAVGANGAPANKENVP
jgi:hypothetical protein